MKEVKGVKEFKGVKEIKGMMEAKGGKEVKGLMEVQVGKGVGWVRRGKTAIRLVQKPQLYL